MRVKKGSNYLRKLRIVAKFNTQSQPACDNLITQIQVQNFGCFDERSNYTLKLAPETLIVGPNNVGKSTFLAAYALVTLGGFNPTLTKFASAHDAVYGHNVKAKAIITVHGEFLNQIVDRTISIDNANVLSSHENGATEPLNMFRATLSNTWYLMSGRTFTPEFQSLQTSPTRIIDPFGGNIIQFLMEKWTSRDELWPEVEKWLRKIDPSMELLSSPLKGTKISLETRRRYSDGQYSINVALQGGGIQRALQIISAVVFSPGVP